MIASDARRPGPGTGFEARSGAGAAAIVLAATGGERRTGCAGHADPPFLDRYRGDGEDNVRDLYDGRLFREEIFLPVVAEVASLLASFDVRTWSLPDPDGRLGPGADGR